MSVKKKKNAAIHISVWATVVDWHIIPLEPHCWHGQKPAVGSLLLIAAFGCAFGLTDVCWTVANRSELGKGCRVGWLTGLCLRDSSLILTKLAGRMLESCTQCWTGLLEKISPRAKGWFKVCTLSICIVIFQTGATCLYDVLTSCPHDKQLWFSYSLSGILQDEQLSEHSYNVPCMRWRYGFKVQYLISPSIPPLNTIDVTPQ